MCIQIHTDLFILGDLVDKASVLKQLVECGILDLLHPEERSYDVLVDILTDSVF